MIFINFTKVHILVFKKDRCYAVHSLVAVSGIGGIIGIIDNINELSNISPLNSHRTIKIEGFNNVGGLIGLARNTSAVPHQILISNQLTPSDIQLSFDFYHCYYYYHYFYHCQNISYL